VGKVPLNYLSWLLSGQNLRGNMSDLKQIEWSWQDFVLWKLWTHSPCFQSIEWDLAGSLIISSELQFPLDWLKANWVVFRGYCFRDTAKSHSICLQSFFIVFSSQLLTNQEPGPKIQRSFSHSIYFQSILCIGWNWQEIFPDLNAIKYKGQVPD
jgi:hypothetical protein